MEGGVRNKGSSGGGQRLELRSRALALFGSVLALRAGEKEARRRSAHYLTGGKGGFLGRTGGHD
jgi:hypothetical protein